MKRNARLDTIFGTQEERKAWAKRLEEQRKRNLEAVTAYKRREALRQQLTLNLDIPPLVLCQNCKGMGCQRCKQKGVAEGILDASKHKVAECSRCRGVGRIANRAYVVRDCPDCAGTGKVQIE